MTQPPQRVQDELLAAEALETADRAARSATPPAIRSAADLVVPVAPAPAVVTPPVAPAPVTPQAPKEDFEQKYKTLQGMYGADVVALKGQLRELSGQLQSLKQAKEAPPAEKPGADPADIAKFGDEMMEMVQRYVTGAVQALEARIVQLESIVNGVTQDTAATKEQQFYTLLTSLVPNWRATNADSRWLAWLGVKDDVYGLPRQAALDAAFQRGDAEQVAKVFNAFAASLPVVPPQDSLENQVVPEGAGNTPPPVSEAKPILSSAAITAFYNDLGRGRYAGREAEADAIEAQINTAVAEGRVR